ncbi:MAG: Xaa-Pro peptidase family protein [Acidobacteriota bacterium]|nr:Xaa-Pro peptidase family protein [Acidobacteriota bacterium]
MRKSTGDARTFALRERAADSLAEAGVDALLVTGAANIRYLTGFTGSNGLLVLLRRDSVFFTDPRYTLQAARQVTAEVKIAKGALVPAAAEWLKKKRVGTVGFERNNIRYDQYETLAATLRVTPLTGVVERFRMVKSAAEIDRIRAAVRTNSAAFERALKAVKPGMTESALAGLIEYRMRRLGADGPAFETIVAAGVNGAFPHARPGAARIGQGQLVLVDMGATLNGYTSDMSRMFHVGTPPGKVKKLYAAVLEAQLAALDAVRPGTTGGAIDAAARRVLKSARLGDAFVHSTGHGLGLEIHENPRIGKKDKTRMEAGMAITIEPGIYLEGWGGIRIEDTVVVTERGCEVLTPTGKELRVL